MRLVHALREMGIDSVLAPLLAVDRKLSSELHAYPGYCIARSLFICDQFAVAEGLNPDQWRHFRLTLSTIHGRGLEQAFLGHIRQETFELPSAQFFEQVLMSAKSIPAGDDARSRLAALHRERESTILAMLDRARFLGVSLRSIPFHRVICHGDIRAANILVGEDGRIWLVDWDGPLMAPGERDLLFDVDSRVVRRVEPAEEKYFFNGYGHVPVGREALVYFRYEHLIEDIGEIGRSVLWNRSQSEEPLNAELELAVSFLSSGGDVEVVEQVVI